MMIVYQRMLILPLIFFAVAGASTVEADTVYLKDGTTQESDRIWLSKDYVHFILKGTSGVEIRYSKAIVDRIKINGVVKEILSQPEDGAVELQKKSTDSKQVSQKKASVTPTSDEATASLTVSHIDPQIVQANKGISFYDPRRKQRYWADRNSKHSTLDQALSALAQIYGRSVTWVESNMGTENDLGIIHQNLMRQHEANASAPSESLVGTTEQVELFFNQNEAYPYRTGQDKAFRTQTEALQALAAQYGRSVQWVQDHFGMANDLKTIHANLAKAASKPAEEQRENQNVHEKIDATDLMHRPRGLQFYNPRRKEKYWIGKTQRYNSLNEAMAALANQYNVTVEWIESHMGNTNNLNEIHKNIQKSLK